jgi:hypothetical protein
LMGCRTLTCGSGVRARLSAGKYFGSGLEHC